MRSLSRMRAGHSPPRVTALPMRVVRRTRARQLHDYAGGASECGHGRSVTLCCIPAGRRRRARRALAREGHGRGGGPSGEGCGSSRECATRGGEASSKSQPLSGGPTAFAARPARAYAPRVLPRRSSASRSRVIVVARIGRSVG